MSDSSNPSTQANGKEIAAFLELAKAFSGQTDLPTLLRLIKEESTKLMGADRASIFLVDKETRELWTLLADGVGVLRFPYGKGIVGCVIEKNEIMNIPDADNDPRFYKEIDRKTGYHTRNILCVPMRNRYGQAVGAIEILNKDKGDFTEYDENLLMILGTQSAVAVENVEMLEDVQESLKQLNLLNRIQKQANYYVDIHSVLGMVLKEIVTDLDADFGIIAKKHASGSILCSCFVPPDQFGSFFYEDKKFKEWLACSPGLSEAVADMENRMRRLHEKEIVTLPAGAAVAMKDQDKLAGYLEVGGLHDAGRLFNHRAMDFLKVIAGLVVSFIENRHLLEEKSRTEKMAVVGNMVSVIVHDIKNPLSGISGYAQLIKRKSSDEKIKEFANVMLEELARLEEMNSELLTFVRGEQVLLDISDTNVQEYTESWLSLVRPNFDSNGIKVTAEHGFQGNIKLDVSKAKRIFLNIANNARDAMKEGGEFFVSTRLSKNGKFGEFELRDTGEGMSPEVKARLFEPFFTSGKKGGTGLGMAIASSIVEKHGGKIEVESEQGKGTSFIISLPI